MPRARLLMVLLAGSSLVGAEEASRFSGDGALVEGSAQSADARFSMQAELGRGDETQSAGRFTLTAQFAASADAKAATATCVPGLLFENGFES